MALMTAASPLALGLVAVFAGGGPVYAQAVNLGGNNIVADGRTNTNIVVDGATTRITTGTVSKGTGFNSFSDFQQAAGTRVDLYVPDGAGNLVNIVRGPVVIDGLLNSYKDGAIGGNIYFSTSQGFVLGANGSINVGKLTVNTPTAGFLDGVVRPDGSVNDQAAAQLMHGLVPISPEGTIAIAGTINATGGITLQGQDVDILGGEIQLDPAARQRLLFGATVNALDAVEGGRLVVQDGQVSIVASGKARIGGQIDASAATQGKGGKIAVRAKDVVLGSTARLTADGRVEGAGGSIEAIADERLFVAGGASISARGAGDATGGFVELSGRRAEIGAVHVALGSDRGAAGTLLFDPYDLIIGGSVSDTGPSDDYSVIGTITSDGANVILQADNSITVSSGGRIDTTSTSGPAGSITLEAPLITIADGAWLNAGTTGDITLRSIVTPGLLSSTATAGIVIGTGDGTTPILSGRNISLIATATVDSGLLLLDLPTAHATIAVNGSTITAAGAFTATATATVDSGLDDVLPIGIVVADVLSSVSIAGAADITAASASLTATSAATVKIATESLVPADSTADGAVAISTITSKALVDISGSARMAVAGALDLAAKNDVVSIADATPQAAQFGASVAVSVIDAETAATIGGNAQISAGSLSLDARTTTAVTVTAKAAAGGGGEPQDGSKTKEQLDKYGEEASTSEGSVSVVGGFAVSDLTSTTLARLASAVAATVGGATSVTTQSANSATVVADGSAVESTTGVGVAVGINLAHVGNDALVAQGLTTGSLAVSAGMANSAGNVFTTTATSGAGAKDVGIAGSLAVNLVDTQSSARIGTGATVTITGGGAVSLTAGNTSSSTGKAVPTEATATGDTLGVGVSAAINIVANRSTAELADTATLGGAGALTLSAGGVFAVDSEAKAGSAGGISVTPALALSLVSNTTMARLGTGAELSAGSVSLAAVQQSTITTNASAKAKGSDVAIGAALALALVNDSVTATTARNVTTTGTVSFTAMGASLSTLTAEASAAGGKAAKDDGSADGEEDVDGKVDDQLAAAKTKRDKADVGDTDQKAKTDADVDDKAGRSASTSEGGVSVAAAIGVNVQTATVTAVVPDGVVIDAGGTLTLRTAANTDGKITADGSAVTTEGTSGPAVGIGAAVAVNKVSASNVARLGVATHDVGGLTIEALKTDIAAGTGTRADVYLAKATSGAGASKVGIAGSLALNLIDTESSARIAGSATVNVTGGGAVSLSADNRSGITATALPTEAGVVGGKVGVGVSAAINIVANRAIAELADDATLAGTGARTLSANGLFTAEAEAKAGSAGGISITPALGLNLVSNTTTARLGSGATLSAGSVSLSAVQQSSVTTKASAKAAGESVAVGAALALALVNDAVSATTARSITTTGAVSFTAEGKSSGELSAEAGAAGAKAAKDDGSADGEKDVDGKVDDQLTAAKTKQDDAKVGDADQKAKTDADVTGDDGKAKRSAKTEEGKVSVAAAVAVNVTESTVTAVVPDGVAISAGGSLTIASANTTGGKITADGSATKAEIAIGVAVAVNAVEKTNTARLGIATHAANGVTVKATQFGSNPANPDVDVYEATATSGAGGGKVGIAGSLALNLIKAQTSAEIAGGASVNAGSGASAITADQRITASASALPTATGGASGGKVGIGASVALNLITDTTEATLSDGAAFTGGASLAVSANSTLSTTTKAEAGAAGGVAIDAVVALAMIDQTTTAKIGTSSTGLTVSGAVSVTATSGGDHAANADGNVKAGNVGVGAAAAVIIGGGDTVGILANTSVTSASLARNVTAAASLAISASSARTYVAEASATAGGGKSDSADSDKAPDKPATSTKTLADTEDYQKGNDAAADQSEGKAEGTGSAGSGGKVQVAAAVGVAVSQDVVTAGIAGGVTVSASGQVAVTASNTVDMATVGSGQAGQFGGSSNAQVAVGVGVALGINTSTTAATIGDGARITQAGGGVEVAATTRENVSEAFAERLTARAIAGASSSKVSVAGALAVGISLTSGTASVGDNVVISSAGAVRIATDNQSQISAKALSGSYTSGNAAIGASIATVYSERDLVAEIGNGAQVSGTDVSVTAVNRKVDAPPSWLADLLNVDDFDLGALKDKFGNVEEDLKTKPLLGQSNYYAEAIGGAAAPSGVAVQGSFAVMIFDDTVTASIGASQVTASGSVTLDAQSDFAAKAMSGGVAVGNSVGVGVSATVVVSSGTTRALLADNATVTITGAGAFSDKATASQDILTIGLAAGAASTAGIAGVANVVVSQNTVEALVGKGATITTGGSVTLAAQNDFTTFGVAAGMGVGGTAGVGAGASAIIVKNVTRAALADGTGAADAVTVDAAGAFGISAKASETGTAITFAGGAAGTAGVGAGAAVYVLDTTTEALVGNFARIGQTTAPSALEIEAEDTTTLTTVAGSLGVGGTAGVGAGAAVGVVAKTVTAAIGSDATVAATDIGISARNLVTSATVGIGAGVGGTAGVAGAVAVFSITDTTIARIAANATVRAQNNVAVLAQDGTSLDTIAGSAAGGGTAGVGASASVTVIDTTTHALIADNASVTALGNGAARQYVAGYEGALGSHGADDDFVGPDLARYDLDTPSGNADAPVTAEDAMTAGLALLTQKRVAAPITHSASGVIVNAASTTEVRSMAVGGAVGGTVGVSLAADVPVITTDTRATIGASALINQGTGTASNQQSVIVAAASDLYHFGLAGSLAGGGAAGVGGGGAIAIIDATTQAGIGTGATTSAQRDIGVTAQAREDFVSVAAAAAGGGTVGVAGGVTVIVVDTTTTATLGGTAFARGNVDVVADDKTRVSMLAGSVGIGVAGGGVGASVGVVKLDKTVNALIANSAVVTALGVGGTRSVYTGATFLDTRMASGVNVLANSNQSAFTLAVAGGGGLYAGIAGAVTLELVNTTTSASIGADANINTIGANAGAAATQDVVVTARDSTATLVIDGGVAGGLVGIAGAVDVGVFRNTTSAFIRDGTTVNAARHVAVGALSNKAGSSTAVSAAGGIVGVAAGISIYSYGNGVAANGEGNQQIEDSSKDGGGSLAGILGMADDQANNGEANDLLAVSDDTRVSGISQSAQNKRAALDFTGAATDTGTPGGTSASIGNVELDAGGDVTVASRDDLDVKLITGAVGGGLVGVGAGIGVLTVDTDNTARIWGGLLFAGGNLAVTATTNHTLGAVSLAGSIGLAAAVSGDVAVISDTSRTKAYVDSGILRAAGDVAVNTTSIRNASAKGYGVSVGGGGAIGISLASITLGGTVSAYAEDADIGSFAQRAASVTVEANATDSATTYTIAGSGGIGLALQGSAATATVGTTVSAYLHNTSIYASGGVALRSLARQQVAAEAEGYAVAGYLAAGASVALAKIEVANSATVTGGSLLDAGSIEVSAVLGPADSTAPAAAASASGSSGALVGITATEARASNTSSSNALVEASTLRASGLVKVAATGDSSQRATSSGLAVGIVAIGSNTARALSSVTTQAVVRDISTATNGFVAGAVEVSAAGTDVNFATSEAGSGGVVAGSAARAETTTASTTLAAIETSDASRRYTIAAPHGLVTISAVHIARFGGSVDSTQASLAGKSGATLVHAVTANVDAHLGDYATLRAADLSISARNITQNFFLGGETAFGLYPGATPKSGFNSDSAGWNVNSGSGGLIDLPAGSVAVNIAHTTNAAIGKLADVHLLAKSSGTSRLDVEAYNEVIAHQKAKLDSGGAIAVASAEILMAVNAAADVSVGQDSDVVVDIGDISLAAWGQADLEARSAATTYGVAGAPSGKAYALYAGTNTVDVGRNVRLVAADGITPMDGSMPTSGTVSLNAGADLGGRQAALRFRTTVDLFNNTAIPIDSTPDARVVSNNVSNIVIQASDPAPPDSALYGIQSAGDITLRALGGDVTASAVGIGKNIYLEALSEVASAISNLFGGDDITFEVHGGSTSISNSGTATIDGLLYAGLQRHKTLTISYTDNDCIITSTSACLAPAVDGEIGYTVSDPQPVGTTILDRLAELEMLLLEYNDDPVAKGAYQSEITFLQTKLVGLGLGRFNDQGEFVSEDYVKPSPAVVQGWIDLEHDKVVVANQTMSEAAAVIVSTETGTLSSNLTLVYTGNVAGNQGIVPNSETVVSNIQTIVAALGVTATTTAFNDRKSAIDGLIGVGEGLALQIANLTAANAGYQTDIDNAIATIATQRLALETALTNGQPGSTALAGIDAAIATINDRLGRIADNNAAIATRYQNAATNAQDIASAVAGIRSWAAGLSGLSAGQQTTLTNLQTNVSAVAARAENVAPLRAGFTTDRTQTAARAQEVMDALDPYRTLLLGLTENVAAYADMLNDTATTPTARSILVDDATVRLANVSVFADRLRGSGSLQAPGDALIEITNNTAYALKLGNLIIPDHDAANVRFNGVLVHSAADIDALNPTGTAAVGLDVVDKLSSSRARVIITSNYNPDSAIFLQPPVATPQVAPDIILGSGARIGNPTGSVDITSAAGNIYIQGQIDAGSLSIIAKNGDFVSSYVNGFDHKGGDPASFNNPHNPSEAGRGIIVNGSISIAARYLNINSTIQSGIANRTLTLGADPTLTTTDAAAIGLDPTDVAGRVQTYRNAVTASGSADVPLAVIDLGGGITLNMGPSGLTLAEAPALQAAINAYRADTNPNKSPVYNVTIGGVLQPINIRDYISGGITGQLVFSMSTLQTYMDAPNATPADLYALVTGSSIEAIGATYDAVHNQYVVDGTRVNGGYIQLYGQIINTAYAGSGDPVGRLNVLDGFGTINIVNNSAIPVVLQTLHTGEDRDGNGRGTKGQIEISDVFGVDLTDPTSPIVQIRRTTYTRDYDPTLGGSGLVRAETAIGRLDENGDFLKTGADVPDRTWAGRDAYYDPTAGLRYVWTEGEKFRNINTFSRTGTRLFNSDSLTLSSNLANINIGTPTVTSRGRLAEGTYLSTDRTVRATESVYRTANGVYFIGSGAPDVDNLSIVDEVLVTSNYSYLTYNNLEKTGESSNCVWYTVCVAWDYTYDYRLTQEYTTITTNSLKADNRIGVYFIGSDTGGINVQSNTDIVLAGNITGIGGAVSINAGTAGAPASIHSTGNDALVTGRSISFNATGSVGGVNYEGLPLGLADITGEPAIAVLLRGGTLSANAGDGVVKIAARGDVAVGQITAAGNAAAGKGVVNLVAAGSISAANPTSSLIQGQRVSLSAGGSIGSTADGQLLKVNTGFTADPLYRPFGDPAVDPGLVQTPYYGLTATAGGDIGIASGAWAGNADGTMLVDKVLSIGGDVRLASSGRILDNNPVESIDSRTYDQLVSYWESLGLLADDPDRGALDGDGNPLGIDGALNAEKQAATIEAYENARDRSYEQYWQIRRTQADGGAVYDPDFTFTVAPDSAQYIALSQQFEAIIRAERPDFNDQQVAEAVAGRIAGYETSQTQLYRDLNDQVGSFAYDPGYTVTVTPGSGLYATLSNEFGAEIRADNPDFDTQQVADAVALRIADFAAAQTALYHEVNGDLTATYVAGYAYGASAQERTQLTRGATWTERQLAFSLSPGALKTITATNPIIKEPNVSGRTVTIEAAFGVGETVGAGTSDIGISIRADIDPRDMTIAQKVALAAAERSDLQLTVQFGGATVDIPLGTDRADMTTEQRAAFDAAVAHEIDPADMTIVILAKRPLNFNAPDTLNVTVATPPNGTLDRGTAYLASRGNGVLGSISVPGETRIKVIGTIINAAGGSAVNTGNLVLEAAQGGIGAGINPLASPDGTPYPPLQLALNANSTLTARAQNGVNIEFTGSALIDTVYSPQDVRLASTGSLLNANGDLLINILGTNVLLEAAGSIGTASHALNVGSNIGGGITASAGGLINLFGSAGHRFVIAGATSTTGSVKLTAALEGVIDGAVTAPGRIDLVAGTRLVISSLGQVHSFGNLIDARAGALKMIDGASLVANAGRIVIETDGDALVTGIDSGASDSGGDAAVAIVSGGRVFAGTDPDRVFDIKAMAAGASVSITAALGIGDKTQANAKWQDGPGDVPGSANAVTDTPNPLRILSSAVALEATEGSIYAALLADPVTVRAVAGDGSIYLTSVGKFHGTLLEALKGTVSVEAGGDIDIDQLHALKVILDTEGALRLPDLEVGEEAVLRANELEANIRQVPSGPNPLKMTLTGGKGKVGTWASVTVDAPAGLILPLLRFYESDIQTTAKFVSILSAYVPGSAKLTTPLQTLLVENRTPAPQQGFNVQMFQPDFAFALTLDNFHTTTNAFVVRYDRSAQVTDVLNRLPYEGASLVRDTIRAMMHGMPLDRLLVTTIGPDGEPEEREILFEDQGEWVVIDGVTYPVATKGPRPAVQLGAIAP